MNEIPVYEVRPGLLDTVRYAAAMWEFQRLHFDHAWARREGLAGAVVQGPLLGNYLARTVTEALPAGQELARLAWRNVAVVPVDEPLRCGGSWTAPDAAELWICDGSGAVVVSGTAELRRTA